MPFTVLGNLLVDVPLKFEQNIEIEGFRATDFESSITFLICLNSNPQNSISL